MIRHLAAALAALTSSAALAGNVATLSYASTNVTTGAYVTLLASTPISAKALEICDTSGRLIKLATGGSGSEVDIATVSPNSCVVVSQYLVPGTRISLRAIDATANSGYNATSLVP